MNFSKWVKSNRFFIGLVITFIGISVSFQNCSMPFIETPLSSAELSSEAHFFTPTIKQLPGQEEVWLTPPPDKKSGEFSKFLDITRLSEWKKSFDQTSTFKFYIGDGRNEELKNFIIEVKARGKKVAFEVGSVYANACDDGPYDADGMPMLAQRAVDYEGGMLKGLSDSKINLDYLVLDGPFIRMFDPYFSKCVPKFGARMTAEYGAGQIVAFMKAMRIQFPNVKFILLVNFPNWNFMDSESINGVGSHIVDHRGQIFNYDIVLPHLANTALAQGIPFDGLQIDNPYNFQIYKTGTRASGLISEAEVDKRWLRLRKLIELADSLKLKTSLILNSEVEEGTNPSDAVLLQGGKDFADLTIKYAQEFRRRGLSVHSFMIQSWYAVPKVIIPESQPYSFTDTTLKILSALGIGAGQQNVPAAVPPAGAPVVVENPFTPVQPPAVAAPVVSPPAVSLPSHPVYRLFNSTTSDYLPSLSSIEGAPYWKFVGVALYLFDQPGNSRIPIYRCILNSDQSHAVSLKDDCEGAGRNEGILGYAMNSPSAIANKAIYRCQSLAIQRYMMSLSEVECQNASMVKESILGYTN